MLFTSELILRYQIFPTARRIFFLGGWGYQLITGKHIILTSSENRVRDCHLSRPLTEFVMDREHKREPGSSVSVVSGYGLDDRAIHVRLPTEAKIFSLTSVSRPALGPPNFCTLGTRGPFPGGKARTGRDADHSPQYRAGVKNE
jgi:hypothetical protein